MLLCLYSLVQTIAPAAAFHDTACLLVHDLDLAVHDNILVVLVEHGVSIEQLLQGVHTVALNGIVVEHVVFLVNLLLLAQRCNGFKLRQLCGDVGQHEQILVVNLV